MLSQHVNVLKSYHCEQQYAAHIGKSQLPEMRIFLIVLLYVNLIKLIRNELPIYFRNSRSLRECFDGVKFFNNNCIKPHLLLSVFIHYASLFAD